MISKTLLGSDGLPLARTKARTLDAALPPDIPDISRRSFTKLAGSSFLALPLAAPRIAGAQSYDHDDEEDEERRAVFEQLFIRNPQIGRVILTGILIVMATGLMYYANVSQGAVQFEENRLSTGSLFGGLTRPTIVERLSVATAVGNVYLWGTILVVMMAAGQNFIPAALTFLFVHRHLSWEVTSLAQVSSVQGIPSFADIQATAVIALCYYMATMSMLMCFIPPPNYRA